MWTKVWVFWNCLRIRLFAVRQPSSVVIFISSFSGGVGGTVDIMLETNGKMYRITIIKSLLSCERILLR